MGPYCLRNLFYALFCVGSGCGLVVIRGDAEVVVGDLERIGIVQDGGESAMVDGRVEEE